MQDKIDEGRSACDDGIPIFRNPYDSEDEKRFWEFGWLQRSRERFEADT